MRKVLCHMTITMYSLPASVCRACWSSERRFDAYGVEVTKVRVDLDPVALERIKELGYSSAPVVVVEQDGRVVDHWSGFSETKIAALKDQQVA